MKFYVPLFHIHAHSESCKTNFNPRRDPEVGLVDGECSETIFSHVGLFSHTVRNMSTHNRQDQLESVLLYIRERALEDIVFKIKRKKSLTEARKMEAFLELKKFKRSNMDDDDFVNYVESLVVVSADDGKRPNAADKVLIQMKLYLLVLKKRLIPGT